MSLRRPTAALFLFLHFPLEESFRHSFGTSIIISAFSARGVIQTLAWHPVFYFGIFLTICVHLGLSYISWQTCDHLINPEHVWYIIPVFLMFASTFKRTHWLVPGYCLGQISCVERALRWQPRNLRNDDSSLAKIGVILVSCSCGKWSPIDADVSNRFRPQPLETKCCTPRPKWSCTTYLCSLLGILVSSWYLIS